MHLLRNMQSSIEEQPEHRKRVLRQLPLRVGKAHCGEGVKARPSVERESHQIFSHILTQDWTLFLSNVGNKVETWSEGIAGALEDFSQVGTKSCRIAGALEYFNRIGTQKLLNQGLA
jgi:hypothetical protein